MDEERLLSGVILGWIVALLLVMLLAGCSRQSPVSDINHDIQDDVAQLVDYAQNNMQIDADKQLLINGARACASRANAMEKACTAQITACEKENTTWKLSTVSASILALLFLMLWFRK